MKKVNGIVLANMFVTLDTSHFETSELNASALANAAESKKKRKEERERERDRGAKRGEVRKGERRIVKNLKRKGKKRNIRS